MRKHLVTIIIIVVFLVGLSVLLYPYVSDFFNARSQSRAVASYHEAVAVMSRQDLAEMWEAARAYNEALVRKQDRFHPTDEEHEAYNGLLSVTTSGIMGTLEIDAIGVRLPIYHGTSEGVLQVGIGHFEGTSLPIGGVGTHAVITGHRGLPSSTLLTNLDRLEIGDTFVLYVLDDSLWYEVDQIIVVEPDDMGALGIDPEMDYCTLITCTPYGINSHRMLVRGHRIEAPPAPDDGAAEPADVFSEAERLSPVAPLLIIFVPVLLALLVVQLARARRKRGSG